MPSDAEYWKLAKTTKVTIKLRDADFGKKAARLGMAGVALHPSVPNYGKRFINDKLRKVDSNDDIGVWSVSLTELIKACGGVNRDGDVLAKPTGRIHLSQNNGLESLVVRVIERPTDFELECFSSSGACHVGLSGASIEEFKRSIHMRWDAGVGGFRNPDVRYMIYVNGSLAVVGAKNQDSSSITRL